MARASKVEEAVEWYSRTRIVYEALAKKVESIVKEIVDSKNVNYQSVTSRAKSIVRYREKASKEKYKEPRSEIFDMAGIRVITYTDSDAKRVHKIIEEAFEIHPEHSVDKGLELGIDRVGYRSIHCVGTLGKDRLKLPENQIFKDMYFEVQIRTILQHAWAEFEHDRNYKFRGVPPSDIRRRLAIVAGNLELIDREFDSLSEEIDAYVVNVEKNMELGDLSEPINSTSLKAYLNKMFEPLIKEGVVDPELLGYDNVIIEELRIMNIETIRELHKIVPEDFVKKVKQIYTKQKDANFVGSLRELLIIHGADTYFKKAWRKSWSGMREKGQQILSSYGVDIHKYAKKYNLDLD